jgi:hypothetical protein
LRLERIVHWERIASRWRPAFSSHLISRSCGRFRTPGKVRPVARRLAGEPRTLVSHPSPNTPSKASLPSPLRGESVNYVSGTMCYLCLRSLMRELSDLTPRSPPHSSNPSSGVSNPIQERSLVAERSSLVSSVRLGWRETLRKEI